MDDANPSPGPRGGRYSVPGTLFLLGYRGCLKGGYGIHQRGGSFVAFAGAPGRRCFSCASQTEAETPPWGLLGLKPAWGKAEPRDEEAESDGTV
jgi:hypothetical protein